MNDQGRRIGEDHPKARCSDSEVEIAIALHAEGWGYRRLAAKFEVGKQTVKDWVTGRTRMQYPTGFKRVRIRR